jgi:hypothetical protein
MPSRRNVARQTDATMQKGKADADKIRLRQKCDDPEVKKLLAPFTATGLWQPGDRPGQPWIHAWGPISFAALKKTGALEPTQHGLTELYVVANAKTIGWPTGFYFARIIEMNRPLSISRLTLPRPTNVTMGWFRFRRPTLKI